jgi:uridine kinase
VQIDQITERIRSIHKDPAIVVIDGRCASGKTTLAEQLAEVCHGTVVHLDDFFLRPEQRSEKRYRTPGENVDHERFLAEVLEPLKAGRTAVYHVFDCHTMSFGEIRRVEPHGVILLEGSYSMRPEIRAYADLKIFLTVNPEKQLERLRKRNPEKLEMFRKKWIPLEEAYFHAFAVEKHADLTVDTANLF